MIRRFVLVVSVALAALLVVAGPATAQLPIDPCSVPGAPGCEEDPPPPDPEPSPEPSPSPTSSPTPAPSPQPSPEPTPDVSDPSEGFGDVPFFEPFDPGPAPEGPAPLDPQVAPGGSTGGDAGTSGGATGTVRVAGVSRLAAAIPGVFGISFLTALLGATVLIGSTNLLQRGLLVARTPDGGTDVGTTRRWRSMAGVALLSLAGLVGIIGFLRISTEALVPVQIVYLASAGFGVVILSIAGGSLLVAEQLRADESRLTEIEAALAGLAAHLKPNVQEPPRLLDRGAPAATDGDTVVMAATTKKAATKKKAAKKATPKRAAAKKAPARKR